MYEYQYTTLLFENNYDTIFHPKRKKYFRHFRLIIRQVIG